MAKHLLANSLSSITQLAGNPPRYPRNPTEQKRESLVLYIARVPGSRDVILTTLKPRLKNVTAEDVLNCLYYFHVDTPSDVFLMGDMHANEATEPVHEPSSKSIARKPLPERSTIELSEELPQLPESGWQTETTLSRAPSGELRFQKVLKPPPPQPLFAGVLDQKPSLPQRPTPDMSHIRMRRPLGPRPYLSQPETNRIPLPGRENTPLSSDIKRKDPVGGTLGKDLDAQLSYLNETYDSRASGDPNPFSNSSDYTGREPFSITIIRRDPTSGAQWNVGKISDQSMAETRVSPSLPGSVQRKPTSLIKVQLITPGYGQFRSSSITNKFGEVGKKEIGAPRRQDNQLSFDRLVHMTWSKSWDRKYKQHGRSYSDQTSVLNNMYLKSGIDIASTQDTGENFDSGADISEDNIYESGFISPWSGRCEFSTSTSGRSLTCKHILNNPTTISRPMGSVAGVSIEVSELRFNLPSSSATTAFAAHRTHGGRPASSHIPIHPSKDNNAIVTPHPTSYAALYPSDNEDGSDEPGNVLDLSLGREKAGGGIRGKRVKLGKLIVHDEGLKMLDLVIAANMGIWWTIWER